MQKVVLAGASGLVGSSLLKLLLKDDRIGEVLALVRRPLPLSHAKLHQLIVDFDNLDQNRDKINGDSLYCCLGTTRAKTPDLNQYRKIDHDYPVKLAEIASFNHMRQYHFISSAGADVNSSIFYTRLKGETERDISSYAFKSVHIYRPSLLTGKRKEKRPLEKGAELLMKFIDPLLIGPLKKYRSIEAETVALAMRNKTMEDVEGIFIYPSDRIKEII